MKYKIFPLLLHSTIAIQALKLQEEQLETVKVLTCSKNRNLAINHFHNLKTHKRDIYIRCLAAGFLPEETLKITNEIFEKAENFRFTATEIFNAAHQFGTLSNFLKK
ncbi:hypothetical protein ACFO4P_17090 [Epilithonimonas pallida]|uniref:Carboxymuconolactone decarboxylase family protein n=1 Tax=Epilithonimonas pallida TaxID=373671 RepID=A0ABY1R4E1_9FLAO|nr:hypothetical protein [Epilithonimonas pallida]SMP94704.1 hypothetical protein SAMN05421679_106103 [Epilithonimonas pallida]